MVIVVDKLKKDSHFVRYAGYGVGLFRSLSHNDPS